MSHSRRYERCPPPKILSTDAQRIISSDTQEHIRNTLQHHPSPTTAWPAWPRPTLPNPNPPPPIPPPARSIEAVDWVGGMAACVGWRHGCNVCGGWGLCAGAACGAVKHDRKDNHSNRPREHKGMVGGVYCVALRTTVARARGSLPKAVTRRVRPPPHMAPLASYTRRERFADPAPAAAAAATGLRTARARVSPTSGESGDVAEALPSGCRTNRASGEQSPDSYGPTAS